MQEYSLITLLPHPFIRNQMELKTPKLIGFGISDKKTFNTACQYAEGAIIGSAFIKALHQAKDIKESTHKFISEIRK